MRMGSNFGTQNALDKKIQKAAGGKEVFPRKVSAQNPAKKGPAKIVIIGGGACGMSAATQIRRQSDFEITVLSRDSHLSLIHISEPTRQAEISYAVFCLKKKK